MEGVTELFKCGDNIKTCGFGAKYTFQEGGREFLETNSSQFDIKMGKSPNFSVNYPLNLFSLHVWPNR